MRGIQWDGFFAPWVEGQEIVSESVKWDVRIWTVAVVVIFVIMGAQFVICLSKSFPIGSSCPTHDGDMMGIFWLDKHVPQNYPTPAGNICQLFLMHFTLLLDKLNDLWTIELYALVVLELAPYCWTRFQAIPGCFLQECCITWRWAHGVNSQLEHSKLLLLFIYYLFII